MADWTANSGFGTFGTRREPTLRTTRETAPQAESPRAERFVATRAYEEEPRRASSDLAEYNAALGGPLAKARLAVWAAGGLVSLALLAGIGVWGYKLVLREVLGLPVVIAENGPMRVVPADPGGEVVPQQGLAVNAVPAAGTAAPPSDVLMLAPQAPGLAEEDMDVVQTMAEADELMPAAAEAEIASEAEVATAALPPAQAQDAAPAAMPAAPDTQPAQLVASLLPNDRPMTADEILAFADQVAGRTEPLAAEAAAPAFVETAAPAAEAASALPAAPEAAPVAALALPATPEAAPAAPVADAIAALVPPEAAPIAQAAVAVIAANVPGVAEALRPPARPAARTVAAAVAPAAPEQAAPVAAPAAVAPAAATPASGVPITASLPSGTNLVQLGAFDSPEIAASEWTRLQGTFGEFLGGKERVIQETQSGGRTLYRLRAMGFADRADARILCAALTAEDAACIPVTVD